MKKSKCKAANIKFLAFTLLEVIISLILSTIIMSVLLYYYFQVSQASVMSDLEAVKSFKTRYLESRLQDLTLRFLPPNNKDHVFFSGNPQIGLFLPSSSNLIFSYDNGKVLNGPLSSFVLGRLFVDPEKRLTLITWEDLAKWEETGVPPFHREILFENVDEFAIDYFVGSKTDIEQTLATRDELRLPKWLTQWGIDFQELPALIRFKIKTGDEELIYAFPLANKNAKVIYKT